MSKPQNSFTSETKDSLLKVLAGPGLMVLARMGGAIAGMIFTLLLTRSMGAAGTGQVSVAISFGTLLALACTLNIENGAVRFMIQDKEAGKFSKVAGYIAYTRMFVLKVSVLVTVLASAALAISGYPLSSPLYLAVLSGPILGFMRLGAGFAQGFSRPVLSVIPRTLLRPAFMAIAVGLWIQFVGPPNPWIATVLFVITTAIVLLAQILMLKPEMARLAKDLEQKQVDISKHREWVKIGLTLGLNVLFLEYSIYLSVLFAALVLSAAETARLDVLLKLIALLRFGLISINQYFMPRMSVAMGNGNRETLENLIAISGIMRLAIFVIGGLAFLLFGGKILSLFGPDFANDQPYLVLLLLEALTISYFGPGSNIIGFSKQPHRMLPILLVTLAALCFGTVAFGYYFGLAGVIWTAIIARIIWLGSAAIIARRITGIDITMASLPRYLSKKRKTNTMNHIE